MNYGTIYRIKFYYHYSGCQLTFFYQASRIELASLYGVDGMDALEPLLYRHHFFSVEEMSASLVVVYVSCLAFILLFTKHHTSTRSTCMSCERQLLTVLLFRSSRSIREPSRAEQYLLEKRLTASEPYLYSKLLKYSPHCTIVVVNVVHIT